MCAAERQWRLPVAMEFLVVVLLLKPAGGDRPIGLFVGLVRVWLKLRRAIAQQWEAQHPRRFFYGDKGKSAVDAAWRQALAAEHASAMGWHAAALFSDLAKAYETIDHDILWAEAQATGFHLGLLHLLLWLYRGCRVVSVGGVCSAPVWATRTVVAGCAFATTLMRIMLLRFGDRLTQHYSSLMVVIFVDDVQGLVVGPGGRPYETVVAAAEYAIGQLEGELKLQVSRTKTEVLTSGGRPRPRAFRQRQALGVAVARSTKCLGIDFSCGRRASRRVQQSRLKRFGERRGRFRMLGRAGVDVGKLLRTGGTAAMTYGAEVAGAPPSLLRQMRAAARACLTDRTAGKSLTLDLALRDGRPDPAYLLMRAPLVQWARAVGLRSVPPGWLHRTWHEAQRAAGGTLSAWSVVRGPAGAVVASLGRLGWTALTATMWVTPHGPLDLEVHSPALVALLADRSAEAVLAQEVAASEGCPELSGGVCLGPIRALVCGPRSPFSACERGALRSVVVNGQWPQARLQRAGLAGLAAPPLPPGTLRCRGGSSTAHGPTALREGGRSCAGAACSCRILYSTTRRRCKTPTRCGSWHRRTGSSLAAFSWMALGCGAGALAGGGAALRS